MFMSKLNCVGFRLFLFYMHQFYYFEKNETAAFKLLDQDVTLYEFFMVFL